MTNANITRRGVHPTAKMHADEYRAGKISRREFLARSTALGVSATAAYAELTWKKAGAGIT